MMMVTISMMERPIASPFLVLPIRFCFTLFHDHVTVSAGFISVSSPGIKSLPLLLLIPTCVHTNLHSVVLLSDEPCRTQLRTGASRCPYGSSRLFERKLV